jgi:acetoin utilization protein AcuC
MKPERFTLAVELMDRWGLLDAGDGRPVGAVAGDARHAGPAALVVAPEPVSDEDLLLVHDPGLVEAVRRASSDPAFIDMGRGLGPGDTPVFSGMHEVTKLIAGGTRAALASVVDGVCLRAMCPAGGLHHAHRDRAAGFCVYNDCALAIERATRDHPGLRVAYVDVDAHHADGVQETFWDRADVLTLSVHESGRYLYPGTGGPDEVGEGEGAGCALDVPLPPGAGPGCFALVLERVIAPALRAYRPDVVVLQAGGDAHQDDPLTHLEQTVRGFADVVGGVVALADRLCHGRIVVTGGGGYEPYSAVPRQWACAMAALLGVEAPALLPEDWLRRSHAAAESTTAPLATEMTFFEVAPPSTGEQAEAALEVTRRVVEYLEATHPLLETGGPPTPGAAPRRR